MKKDRKSKYIVILVIVIVLFFIYRIISHFENQTPSLPPPTVIVTKPVLSPMTDYVTLTGNTVAYNSVDLVARVEGYLESVEFTDGSFVKKGKELFVIEPLPYLENLKASEASLAAQKAAYAYAKSEFARQQQMYKQNATSLNNVQKWEAKRDETQAEVAKAAADVVNAGINYSYTHVLAPFDGRIGRHLVDPGNLVGNGKATDLATIEQIDPIYVYFNLNELDLFKIREAAEKAGIGVGQIYKVPVYVGMQNENGFSHPGHLDFVNTGLNASTGTIEFRALLENKDFALLPGLFVQVRIPISKPVPQLTVPDTAVLYDQIGSYVFVTDKNNVVQLTRVELGAVEEGRRAIVKGLNADDNVIVDGLQNATPGNAVTVKVKAG